MGLPPDEDFFYDHMLRANYQAKIWYDFSSSACSSSSLNHGYAIDGQLPLPVRYSTDACSKFLNQLHIEDKSDVKSSDSSNEEYSDYESSYDDDDDNHKSDNNDEDRNFMIQFLLCLPLL